MQILLFSAALPVVIFLYFIYKKDSEKEPVKLLLKCFLWGCIAIIPIIIIEMLLDRFNIFTSAFLQSFYRAFVVAALVEEGVKFLCLSWIIWKHREFDQYYDGIVYAVFVSLGFALVENILYVIQGGIGVSIARAILAVPLHGLCGVIMGYFFALAKFSRSNNKIYLWLGFVLPLFSHGAYDFFIFYYTNSDKNISITMILLIFFVALIFILWRCGIGYIKKHCIKDTESQSNQ